MPTPAKITSVQIRMYRAGTGDFFVLLFKKGSVTRFRMMIDCGCINGGKETFKPLLANLEQHASKTFDLLVVTHQHADHINGFEKCADLFDKFTFKKVWFAWTEDDTDPVANDYRKNHSELAMAVNIAAARLHKLLETNYYEDLFQKKVGSELMVQGRKHFIQSLAALSALNPAGLAAAGQPLPTMAELFKDYKVVKANTEIEYLEPGDVKSDLPGAPGIRFYVLGPPRDRTFLNRTEAEGESFEKREKKSTVDFSFLSAVGAVPSAGHEADLPFGSEYEAAPNADICKTYEDKESDWRKIDYDWLYSARSRAMRYERSINNTSLALAIQFEESERVLLFPGDAELGNWESWHNKLEWPAKVNGQIALKKVDYLLGKTVFYKVGHHLSQNGTAKGKGIDLMTSSDLTAMATLDFKKINAGWLNTMPNDLLGAELVRKTKGKFYFVGDCKKILANIKTDRVTVKNEHKNTMTSLNGQFDGQVFIDCEVQG